MPPGSSLLQCQSQPEQQAILQPARWNEILEKAVDKGKQLELSRTFVETFLRAVHQESIEQQARVMVEKEEMLFLLLIKT